MNPEHLAKLKEGVKAWNRWRKLNPTIEPDLFEANLDSADLTGANLKKADLVGAKLSGAKLSKADLRVADLSEAYLIEADLSGANLSKAYLREADLSRVNLSDANLREADLSRVNLSEANLSRANLSQAFLYKADLSMADLAGVDLSRVNLIEANLSEAKLIGASFHRAMPSKIVLILGRFIPERKVVLDAIREKLRKRGYVPVLCGFEWTTEKKVTEIAMLAHMARFIIADLTDPTTALYELARIVPDITVPVQAVLPEIEGLQREYSSFFHPERSHWFLKPYHYKSPEILIAQLDDQVIAPAEARGSEPERARAPQREAKWGAPQPVQSGVSETPPEEVQLGAPETPFEEVQLGASAPRDVRPGEEFVARFAAYTESRRKKVYRVISQEAPSASLRLDLEKCRWRRGAKVVVRLDATYVEVSNPVQDFIWNGAWSVVRFDARVLDNIPVNKVILRFDVAVQGFPIVAIRPEVVVSRKHEDTKKVTNPVIVEQSAPKSAFASYAKKDKRDVLGRVRSLEIFTGIDVFLDCLSLRPGEEWKLKLIKEIRERDIFWLFWSRSAKASEWVTWEWRTALAEKSLSGIQPHPLEPSDLAPPPPELSDLQFGAQYEWYISHLRQDRTRKRKQL